MWDHKFLLSLCSGPSRFKKSDHPALKCWKVLAYFLPPPPLSQSIRFRLSDSNQQLLSSFGGLLRKDSLCHWSYIKEEDRKKGFGMKEGSLGAKGFWRKRRHFQQNRVRLQKIVVRGKWGVGLTVAVRKNWGKDSSEGLRGKSRRKAWKKEDGTVWNKGGRRHKTQKERGYNLQVRQ